MNDFHPAATERTLPMAEVFTAPEAAPTSSPWEALGWLAFVVALCCFPALVILAYKAALR